MNACVAAGHFGAATDEGEALWDMREFDVAVSCIFVVSARQPQHAATRRCRAMEARDDDRRSGGHAVITVMQSTDLREQCERSGSRGQCAVDMVANSKRRSSRLWQGTLK